MKNLTLLIFLTCLFNVVLAQIPESEPNNAFVNANNVNRYEVKTATVNSTTDDADYFRTILPEDGTLKIYVQATNTTSGGAGWIYLSGYDRRKTGDLIGRYLSGNSSIAPGATIFDTITLHGRAADTVYFRLIASKQFSYQFSYNLINLTPNDIEANGTFATALPINQSETKQGHTNYVANGGTDDENDYYRTILPVDGTMKVYVEATNMSGGGNWLFMAGYDRRKTGSILGEYISRNTSIASGATIYDTITVYGRAADTVYFRLYAANAFSYKFRYEIVDQSTNDVEPNGTHATALPILQSQTKQGHTNYVANGGTYDENDYYKTVLPADGTLKVYLNCTNRSGGSGWIYMQLYDRRAVNGPFYGKYISNNTSIPLGTTVRDTLTIYGRAADTVYFRIYASDAFSYSFRYEMTDLSPNDAEPNHSFATANPISILETKQGHTQYNANGSTLDPNDYYIAILPYDGTLKFYVEGTNTSGGTNWMSVYGYDRRKTASVFDRYVSGSTSVARGATIRDTITVYGRAADTTYFRVMGSDAFSYKIKYDVVDTSANDLEPNNTFAQATTFSGTQVREGHSNYAFNGTTEENDYYKTEFGTNDSLKLYVQATNTGAGENHFYLYGYNAAQNLIYSRYRYSIPAGATIYDSVKIAVTAPQTIYNRVSTGGGAFAYQLTLNSKLPGNGFTITGNKNVCSGNQVYKAINIVDADAVYYWSVTGGGTITFVDNIATVNWTTAGIYSVKLYITNSHGSSVTRSFSVTVNEAVPLTTPIVTVKGRYLSIAALPLGATRRWYKDGSLLTSTTDSVFYAATAGSYTAKYSNDCGEGNASAPIIFNAPQTQTITFPPVANMAFSPDSFRVLAATSSVGLPITYKLISGPGVLRNDTLRATAFGTIAVQALQYGSANYGEATPVNVNVNVVKGSQTITFTAIPDKIYSTATFALDAVSTSGLAVTYAVVSGPATVSGSVVTMKGAGTVQIKARQTGNADYLAAAEVTNSFCIGLRQIEPIIGPKTVCANTICYTTKKITGAIYEWSLSGGGTFTTSNDTAIVQWQNAGTYTLSVKAYSACDTVRTVAQAMAVTVETDYNVVAVTGMIPANNQAGLSLPLVLQWAPSAKATSYDVYVWPASQPEPALPLDSGLTQNNYQINSNLALNQPYNWKVVAKNICSNATSTTQQFSIVQNNGGLPDLVMDTFAFPAVIYQGLPMTITWRVKNIGTKGTGLTAWQDRIFLSPSPSIRNGESTFLGDFNNPSYLLPGESYTQTKTVTVPNGFAGTWYVGVITENKEAFCFTSDCNIFWGPRYNHGGSPLVESNEYNNYRYSAEPILDGKLPDLQVKSIGVPGATFGGSNITVTYKVQNQGLAIATGSKILECPQRGWRDRFFISPEPTFNISTAKELLSKDIMFLKSGTTNCTTEALPYADFLQPDSSYTVQHQLLLPYEYVGKQYIYVFTNGYNDVYEGAFNTNNIRRSDSMNVTIAPPADLVVTNIQDLGTVQSGSRINVNYTVTNQGANVPQEGGWSDSLFICSTPTFSYDNVIIKQQAYTSRPNSFGNGSSYNRLFPMQIPDGISGTYYVFVKTDAQKEVFEYLQEGNNTLRGNAFTVAMGPLVDLVVTAINAPDTVTADSPFTISLTVKNAGSGTLTQAWFDYVYVNLDSTLSDLGINLFAVYHPVTDTLLPNGQRTVSGQAVIRTVHNFSGKNVYLKAQADGRNFVYEHNGENNNNSVSLPPVGGGTIYVKPAPVITVDKRANIAMQSASVPASALANTSISVNYTVKNRGPLATTKTYWQDRVYLSSDTIFNYGDQEMSRLSIGNYTNSGLLPDSSYQRTATVKLPIQLSGTWYLICITDFNQDVLNDSVVTDNVIVKPINIIAAQTPDLTITSANNLPDSIFGGSVFTVYYTVHNNGISVANAPWYDRVYIQTDAIPNGSPVSYKQRQTSLAAGASYTDSMVVQVPTYMNGAYNVILHADGANVVYEGPNGDANNTQVRAKPIYNYNDRPAPDLIVQSVSIPDSVVLGKNIAALYTIKNAGLYPAAGNLANALYLSGNKVFESNLDKLTATAETANFKLEPGQTITAQLNGKALPPVAGKYYGIVRTNVRNTLHEGPYINNNIKASDTTTFIDARALTLGSAKADTLVPSNGNYYKVSVGANLDLSVVLNSSYMGNGSNALHIAYNRVPDETDYDVTGVDPSTLKQQALVSTTQAGTYYIKAQSFGIPVNEATSITVTALPFSIINASPAVMGKGVISGNIYGAGFKPGTQILLQQGNNSFNVGFIQEFVNSTWLKIEWRLGAVPVGVYDVVAVNPGGASTVLASAVTVEIAKEYKLEYTPLLPSEVRPFGGIVTYKGKNIGNVNIPVIQGDITMVAKNATVYAVSTTGRIRRYTKYIPQADSLMTEHWYLTGKNRAIPFIGRNIAPGEEFSITVELRFGGGNVASEQQNVFPLQCRMIGYSGTDFAKEQIRNIEMMRLILLNDPRSAQYPNSPVIQGTRAGSKYFTENVLAEYVRAGLMQWRDTVGTNLRWDCSRCLQLLPEFRPTANSTDTFTYNPAGLMVVGKDSLGTGQVFRESESLLIEMNKGRYWNYYNGRNGAAGEPGKSLGWDLLDIHGTLFVSASVAKPFKIYVSSLAYSAEEGHNYFRQLGGWNPAYDTSFLIVVASGGINGYEANKFKIDLQYFSSMNPLQKGRFSTELHRGFGLGADSIILKWNAYKPAPGEAGIDGVNGALGQPGSPGGKGGPGDAQHPTGGKGGKGGRGGDEFGYPPYLYLSGMGGRGGDGGLGYGTGGDGGDAGDSGDSFVGDGVDGQTGGEGEDAGPTGGGGGAAGNGSKGGNGGLNKTAGKGGDGGTGGNGVNSSYGGRGGNGGEGGKGGSGCGQGVPGGAAGDGGTGGTGPLGMGSNGASGKKGIFGASLDCPPCSTPIPPTGDAKKAADKMIDYGKAAYGTYSGLAGGDVSSPKGLVLEWLNQETGEYSPGINVIVNGVDLLFDLTAKGATFTWTVTFKTLATAMKVGDFAYNETYGQTGADGNKTYEGQTEVKFLIDATSAISSVPDLIAFGFKQLNALGAAINMMFMVKPCDPNEINGPAGYASQRFISRNAEMAYNIHFENDSASAEVAAQRVVIRQPIHPKADPLTFKLGDFNFGGMTFAVPEGRTNYFTVLNLDTLGYRVEVTAGVDIVNHQAFWIMQAIDPQTGLPPANVFTGFLPVNDESNKGTGFVRYSIKPMSTAVTGDSITAKAAIVFDENEPVETNTWVNIVDAVAPTSSLNNLPPTSNNPVVNLSYSGTDDVGGTGIKYVDIYVSDNGATPIIYAQNFTSTDTLFYGEQNHTYTFYGQATDHVDNKEVLKNMGSVTITNNSCLGGLLTFSSSRSGNSYQWQVNTGSGWVNVGNDGNYSGATSKVLAINNAAGSWYGYQYRALVNGNTYSDIATLRFASFWQGTTSKAWEDPTNWSCGTVPDQYTDVVIPSSKQRFPDVNSNVTIRTLRVNTGATVTVKAGANVSVLK